MLVRLNLPSVEKDGVLYIPVRALNSLFNYSIEWNTASEVVSAESQTVDSYAQVLDVASFQNGHTNEKVELPLSGHTGENKVTVTMKSLVDSSEIKFRFSDLVGEKGSYSVYVSEDGNEWSSVCENISLTAGYESYYETIRKPLRFRYVKFVADNTSLSEFYVTGTIADTTAQSILNCVWSGANGEEVGTNTYDGNLSTLWSDGTLGCWIQYEFDKAYTHKGIDIVWNNGDKRVAYYDVLASDDGENWVTVIDGASTSGKNAGFERTVFNDDVTCRFIRIVCNGNSSNDWGAIKEIRFVRE